MTSDSEKMKQAIEICNEILPLFEGHRVHIALNAIMFALCEVLMNYSPNLQTAKEQLDELVETSIRSLEAFDDDYGPEWTRKLN